MGPPRIVLYTNVLASAFRSGRGASREVLRRVLRKEAQALISVSLFTEYADVLARPQVQRRCNLSSQDQQVLFDAFLACTELVEVYYRMVWYEACATRNGRSVPALERIRLVP